MLLLLLVLPLATACTSEQCTGDGQGMLQLQPGTAKPGKQKQQDIVYGSGRRPYGSGTKLTPNVEAPKFEPKKGSSTSLQLECQGENFLDCWNFFTTDDPTHGYVSYVSEDEAMDLGLFKIRDDGSVYLGSLVGQGEAAKVIRLESRVTFNAGHIFVIDIQHMPTGMGTWPAWWSYGPDWPENGEIDTIETVNIEDVVQQTLHTSAGCVMNIPNIFNPDCNSDDAHNGCGLDGPPNSGGPKFNAFDGGVYATQWTGEGIKLWMFNRSHIPSDLTENQPDSTSWGNPWAFFPFGDDCPSTHFGDHVLTINLDFCGDWAGSVFPGGNDACEGYVRDPNNIEKLKDAYWGINYVKVFAASADPEAKETQGEATEKTGKIGKQKKSGKSKRSTKKSKLRSSQKTKKLVKVVA